MSNENSRKIAQFMLSRGCVTSDELISFFGSLRTEGTSQLTDESIHSSITNMNLRLKKYNMMIRGSTDDKTHKKYYSLISTVDNFITKEASHHSPKEFEFFRLVWQIIRDRNLEGTKAKELADSIKITNHEDLLQEWCEKHWLVYEEEMGEYRIGPRSRAELDVLM